MATVHIKNKPNQPSMKTSVPKYKQRGRLLIILLVLSLCSNVGLLWLILK